MFLGKELDMERINSDITRCTSCKACSKICPKDAITFENKENGFDYPIVNENCVECGICKSVCIIDDENKGKSEKSASKAYLFYSHNNSISLSSSGGAFLTLASKIISDGGVVYGCEFDDNLQAKQRRCDCINAIEPMLGSKYVKSDVNQTFDNVKEDLKNGRVVLYSGTPCQIYGLKKFVGNHEKLITIDLICHGTPSQKLFNLYLKHLEDKYSKKIYSINFRSKIEGWGTYIMELKFKDGTFKYLNANLSSYYYLFLEGFTYSVACYNCKFSNLNRESDITIGDFWGVDKLSKIDDKVKKKGVSLVLINSDKGRKLLKSIDEEKECYLKEVDLSHVVDFNQNLIKSTQYHKENKDIYEFVARNDYHSIEKLYRKKTGVKLIYYYICSYYKKVLSWKIK